MFALRCTVKGNFCWYKRIDVCPGAPEMLGEAKPANCLLRAIVMLQCCDCEAVPLHRGQVEPKWI